MSSSSSTKQPPSTTKVISSKATPIATESDSSSSTSTLITISSLWNLRQLARVYRAAKKMQRVSSAWSDEITIELPHQKDVIKLNASIRTILVPYYHFNNSSRKEDSNKADVPTTEIDKDTLNSAATIEMKLYLPVINKKQEEDKNNNDDDTEESLTAVISISPSKIPTITFKRSFEETEVQAEEFSSSLLSKNEEVVTVNNSNDEEVNFFDDVTGTCFATTNIPSSILSKSAVEEKKITDSTPFDFSVQTQVELSQESLNAAFEKLRKRIQLLEEKNSKKRKQADENVQELVQGFYGAVGGFWDSVKKTAVETADSMIAKKEEDETKEKKKSEEENTTHIARQETTNGTHDENTDDDSHNHQSATKADRDKSLGDKKQQQQSTQPPTLLPSHREPLPSPLSEALASSEKALHRWIKWISEHSDEKEEVNRTKQIAKIQFEFFMNQISLICSKFPLDEKRNNCKKKKSLITDVFTSSFLLLSSFAAASAMSKKDLRDLLSLADDEFSSSSSSSSSFPIVEKFASCGEPKQAFHSVFSSMSTSTSIKQRESSPQPVAAASSSQSSSITSPDTENTNNINESSSSTTTTAEGTEANNHNHNQNNKPSSSAASLDPFFELLLEEHSDNKTDLEHPSSYEFLAHFISTIANVLVVQVQYGAQYRPLLRAQGWAKFIHYFYAVHHQDKYKNENTTNKLEFIEKLLIVGNNKNEDYHYHDSFFDKNQNQVLLHSGYLSSNKKDGDDDTGNDYEKEDRKKNNNSDDDSHDDVFKIITDEFAITKEERMRKHFGMITDIDKLLVVSSSSSSSLARNRFAAGCLIDGASLMMMNNVQEGENENENDNHFPKTLDQLLDFLSEIANFLSSSAAASQQQPRQDNSTLKKLVPVLRKLERNLENAQESESDLWGDKIVSSVNSKLVSARSLKERVGVLLKAIEGL